MRKFWEPEKKLYFEEEKTQPALEATVLGTTSPRRGGDAMDQPVSAVLLRFVAKLEGILPHTGSIRYSGN